MCMKRTNVVLDEKLINEGLEMTGLKTQKALIDRALRDLVRRGRQKDMLRHEGKVRWEGDLNEMREMRLPWSTIWKSFTRTEISTKSPEFIHYE